MKYTGNYIYFEYEETDQELVYILEEYINEHAQRIFDFFNYTPKEKVTVYIIPTKEEYDRKLNEIRNTDTTIPSWNVATTTYDNKILFLSNKGYVDEYGKEIDDYKQTFLHEFIHYVTFNYCTNFNYKIPFKCLSEGIAQYLSNQKENENLEFNCTEEEFINGNKCYDEWLLFTRYVLSNYEKEYFLDLLKDDNYAKTEIDTLYKKLNEYYNDTL